MIQTELLKLKKLLSDKTQTIVITSHKNPDGDAIGSSLALNEYLKLLGYQTICILPNSYPSFLAWLPGNENMLVFEDEREKSKELIKSADIVFSLDYNAFHRTGEMEKVIEESNAKKILIDHHLEPANYFDVSISKIATSSTSELIYEIIDFFGDKYIINKNIAEALYVGIMTDTGSFSYSCNYPETYNIIAHLVKLGVDGELIHQLVYSTFSESRLRLLGYCLSERLHVLPEYKTAYIYLTKEDLKKYNHTSGDTEGVVNYALTIEGVEFAALFTEREDLIRISFRSKGNFSVNNFARKYFDGGGHEKAAGGNSNMNMDDTLKKFKKYLKNIPTN